MPRKRTPKQNTSDNEAQTVPTTPSQPDIQEPAAATAVLDAPPPVAAMPQQTFVEMLMQQRRPSIPPDPFGIAGDYEAGVRLFESKMQRLMVIKFDQKPSSEVLDRMKDAGFRWNPRDQVWVQPIYPESARRIRIEAERTYQEVRQMIRLERGLGECTEIPF